MTTLLRTDRLLVSRQDPKTRAYVRVGTLGFDGERYTFTYDESATRALPGLPLGRTHASDALFPIFAERVMDPHRPEKAETLEHLGLAAEAGPFEVLAVSGGGRTGDTYELTPLPEPGSVSLPFLVHGVRYLTDQERASIDELQEAHFADIVAAAPEVVIFGSGPRLRFPHPALLRSLMAARIGVETMDTAAACRTYNVLAAEGRRVMAALLVHA